MLSGQPPSQKAANVGEDGLLSDALSLLGRLRIRLPKAGVLGAIVKIFWSDRQILPGPQTIRLPAKIIRDIRVLDWVPRIDAANDFEGLKSMLSLVQLMKRLGMLLMGASWKGRYS